MVLPLLERVILGWQHSSVIFFKYLPQLIYSLEKCTQDHDNIAGTTIAAIIQCLLFQFSGNTQVYQVLTPYLYRYDIPTKENILTSLRKYRWLPEKYVVSNWIEGLWNSLDLGGNIKWKITQNVQGRKMRGSFQQSVQTQPWKIMDIAILCEKDRLMDPTTWKWHVGEIELVRQHEVSFSTKDNYKVWVNSSHIFRKRMLKKNLWRAGMEMICKIGDENFYSHGVLLDPTKIGMQGSGQLDNNHASKQSRAYHRFNVRLDSGKIINNLKASRIHLLGRRGNFSLGLQEGYMQGILHCDSDQRVVLLGSLHRTHIQNPAGLHLEFQPNSESLSGRSTWDNHNDIWIGMRRRITKKVCFTPELLTLSTMNTKIKVNSLNDLNNNQTDIPNLSNPKTRITASLLVLDGIGDLVDLGCHDTFKFIGVSPFTIEACIRIQPLIPSDTSVRSPMTIFAQQLKTELLSLYITETGYLSFLQLTSNIKVPLGRFVHIAVTFDGCTIRLYIDFNMVALKQSQPPFEPGNNQPCFLGASPLSTGYGRFFQGCLSQVRVWSYALNLIELQRYNPNNLDIIQFNHLLPIHSPRLLCYYPLISLFGLLVDLSIYKNHALLTYHYQPISHSSTQTYLKDKPRINSHTRLAAAWTSVPDISSNNKNFLKHTFQTNSTSSSSSNPSTNPSHPDLNSHLNRIKLESQLHMSQWLQHSGCFHTYLPESGLLLAGDTSFFESNLTASFQHPTQSKIHTESKVNVHPTTTGGALWTRGRLPLSSHLSLKTSLIFRSLVNDLSVSQSPPSLETHINTTSCDQSFQMNKTPNLTGSHSLHINQAQTIISFQLVQGTYHFVFVFL